MMVMIHIVMKIAFSDSVAGSEDVACSKEGACSEEVRVAPMLFITFVGVEGDFERSRFIKVASGNATWTSEEDEEEEEF